MNTFKKAKQKTLKAHALKQIKNAIRTGKLKPGDRIIETELAQQMGISRFPIREAISSLEREGLVVLIPYKGAYVSKLDENDIEEVYILRCALEQLAVRLLVQGLTKEKIRELDSVFLDMQKAAKSKKKDLVLEDLRFHKAICKLSENRRLLEMWLTLSDQLRSFFAIEQYSRDTIEYLLESHRPILEAIKNGDTRLAEKHLTENINNGLRMLRHIIKEKTE